MQQPLEITIPHALGKEGAKRRVDRSIAKIHDKLAAFVSSIEQEWEDDRVTFRLSTLGQAITGEIEVFDESVRILVDLPGPLLLLGGTIAEQVRRHGTLLLEKS